MCPLYGYYATYGWEMIKEKKKKSIYNYNEMGRSMRWSRVHTWTHLILYVSINCLIQLDGWHQQYKHTYDIPTVSDTVSYTYISIIHVCFFFHHGTYSKNHKVNMENGTSEILTGQNTTDVLEHKLINLTGFDLGRSERGSHEKWCFSLFCNKQRPLWVLAINLTS